MLGEPDNYRVLWNSLFVSVLATIGATVLGTFFAWIMARTDLPGKRWIHLGIMLPFVIPPFIGAVSWIQLLGPVGYVNQLYKFIMDKDEPLFSTTDRGALSL